MGYCLGHMKINQIAYTRLDLRDIFEMCEIDVIDGFLFRFKYVTYVHLFAEEHYQLIRLY